MNMVLLTIFTLVLICGIVLCIMHEKIGINIFALGSIYITYMQKSTINKIWIVVLSYIFIFITVFCFI